MSAPRTRRQHLQQTAAYLAAVTGIPALLRSGSSSAAASGEAGAEGGDEHRAVRENRRSFLEHERASFDTRPREVLAKESAEYLFFGDSMARAHIDPDVVTRLTGKKGGVFYLAHSTSARWYLMLKNYVIPSGAKPKKMFVLFRNCIWHMPTFRIDGSCWEDIERAMEDPADPVISQVIGLESRRGASPAAQLLREDVYPIQTHGESLRQGIQEAAAKLCGLDFEQAKALTNARTSWENFRKGITAEANYDGLTDPAPFSMDPTKSFFPHFLDLAQSAGIALHFIRVRRRPYSNKPPKDPAGYADYLAAMRAELGRRGIPLLDCNSDTALKLDMYAEGDHLDIQHRAWYTERLIQQLGPQAFA